MDLQEALSGTSDDSRRDWASHYRLKMVTSAASGYPNQIFLPSLLYLISSGFITCMYFNFILSVTADY